MDTPTPRALPTLVRALDLLPTTLEEGLQRPIALGTDTRGETVSLPVDDASPLGLSGRTGSGQTVHLRTLITGYLAAGWDVIGIDVGKGFCGLNPLAAHARLWLTEPDDIMAAGVALTSLTREIEARLAVLRGLRVADWRDAAARRRMRPTVVLIDSADYLLEQPEQPQTEADLAEYRNRLTMHAVVTNRLRQIAHHGRAVGIKLIVSASSFRADPLASEVRDLLETTIVAMPAVRPVDRIELDLLLGRSAADEAAEVAATLQDGKAAGLGIAYSDGVLTGYRAAWLSEEEAGAYLDALQLPAPLPFAIEDEAAG